jgi:hypothetical protein
MPKCLARTGGTHRGAEAAERDVGPHTGERLFKVSKAHDAVGEGADDRSSVAGA